MESLIVLAIVLAILWWVWQSGMIPQPFAMLIGVILGLIVLVLLLSVLGVGPGLPGLRLRGLLGPTDAFAQVPGDSPLEPDLSSPVGVATLLFAAFAPVATALVKRHRPRLRRWMIWFVNAGFGTALGLATTLLGTYALGEPAPFGLDGWGGALAGLVTALVAHSLREGIKEGTGQRDAERIVAGESLTVGEVQP